MLTSKKALVLAICVGLASPLVAASEWQPVASDKLITLPANIIEKRIEQDFNASPMADHLSQLDEQMASRTARIKSLLEQIPNLTDDALQDAQYELVQTKSAYLDLLQESHTLREQALAKKQNLYQDVLSKIRNQKNGEANTVKVTIQRQQKEALARMQAVMEQVDQNLVHAGYKSSSPYADEYAANLQHLEQLKSKIAQHQANAAPTIDGAEVTTEEYIRQLLHDAALNQSLLDQEALMLSYMARLVALDAQSLEYQIAYGDEPADGQRPNVAKASQSVDLFL